VLLQRCPTGLKDQRQSVAFMSRFSVQKIGCTSSRISLNALDKRERKKYRICYVVSTYYPSPGATTPYEISSHVASMGHEVYVIGPRLKNQRPLGKVKNVLVYRVDVPGRPVRFSNIILAIKAFIIILRKPPDIVHLTFSPQQFLFPLLGRLFFKLKRTRWIFHLISVSVDKNRIRRFLQNRKFRFESRFFDAVITSNEYIRDKILGKNWRNPVYLVPIGTNCDGFANPEPLAVQRLYDRWRIKPNQRILIYVGTMSGRNLQILIHGFKKMTEDYENVHLFIVGDGKERDDLYRLTQELGISEKVTFTGQVDYRIVPAYLKLADIAISYIPTNDIYDIQPPLKTLEYLAAGLPVVATATIANRIFIRDGYNGVLVEDSVESLSDGIVRLLNDETLQKRLAVHARQFVEHLDWTKIVKDFLIPAYEEILQKE